MSGDSLEILSPGVYNQNAGPDFTNVKIRIGNTTWVGNAEVHIRSSDWERHQHSLDGSYNNVILHIVYLYDRRVLRNDGTEPPTLEIKGFIKPTMEDRYKQLMHALSWIPCAGQIGRIQDIHVSTWLSRMLIERLQEKSREVIQLVHEYKGSWEDAFYVLLARNFGFKVNALPFELVARSLPQQILSRHKNSVSQTEALLFGQAGLLNTRADDAYVEELRREYAFLQKKYHLNHVDTFLWKFLRLRPQNFPTLRMAQFAALILKSSHLFSRILEIDDVSRIRKLFNDLQPSVYWRSHFRFGKTSSRVNGNLGEESINNILQNTVALVIFSYGKYLQDERLVQKAVRILETLPFEKNHITNGFLRLGVEGGHADRSQALLQLKKSWCDKKKCLLCSIGAKIINSD